MPVSLSIKNVPTQLAKKLRLRAARHRRSLQGELMVILEESLAAGERLTADEVLRKARKLGLRTRSESVAMIREDLDAQ